MDSASRQHLSRTLADRAMRSLAQLLIRIFFRGVEIEAGERLPRHGPALVVANHTNGLVDGLLLMAALGRFPRFLGKSTLFRIPLLWPLLKLAGVIPVYRATDGSTQRNAAAFAASTRVLAGGGVLAIFPEGISHDESAVQPLRTGVARIALEADAEGVADLVIVAVGLLYDDKASFRSRALVRVGAPSTVSAWRSGARLDRAATVRRLTGAVAQQLDEVSPPYATWAQADDLARIADIVLRQPGDGAPAEVDLAARSAIAERLASLDGQVGGDRRLGGLRSAYAVYRRDLDLLGLDGAQVASRPRPNALRWAVAWCAVKVVLAVPCAAVGVVIHVIPFEIVKQAAKAPANEGMKATFKLLGCFFLFGVTYAVVGVLVGLRLGPWAGAAAALAAPLCGYVALRAFERVKRVGGLVTGYTTVRDRPDLVRSVTEHRCAVVSAAQALLSAR